jgi:SAM-dependent methyltransferase
MATPAGSAKGRTAKAARKPASGATGRRSRPDGYIPLKIRFKAWWEGIDPAKLMPGANAPLAPEAAEITVNPPAEAPASPWPTARLALCRRLWEVDETDEVVEPGGAAYAIELYRPMGLDSTKSGFDLSAGLGGAVRRMAKERDLWIAGFELDRDLAAEAMRLSVAHGLEKRCPIKPLDEGSLQLGERRSDGVMLRDRLHLFHNKQKLLDGVFTALRPRGHLILTDFVLKSDAAIEDKAVAGWLKRAAARAPAAPPLPWTLGDVKRTILANRMDLRIFEDETEKYLSLVRGGWARFVAGLSREELTRSFVDEMMREAEYWVHLCRALESGKLRHVRAHAIRGAETL